MRQVQIAETDFRWLQTFVDNWVVKCHSNVSGYLEYIEMFDRLSEALGKAKEFTSEDDVLPEPPKVKKRGPRVLPNLCKEHPTYGAKQKPRKECETCWAAYNKLNIAKVVRR